MLCSLRIVDKKQVSKGTGLERLLCGGDGCEVLVDSRIQMLLH